jgi:hypothetical protein
MWAVQEVDYDDAKTEALVFLDKDAAEAFRQTRDHPSNYQLVRLTLLGTLPPVTPWYEGRAWLLHDGSLPFWPAAWVRERAAVRGVDPDPSAHLVTSDGRELWDWTAYRHVQGPDRDAVAAELRRWVVAHADRPISGCKPWPDDGQFRAYAPPMPPNDAEVLLEGARA